MSSQYTQPTRPTQPTQPAATASAKPDTQVTDKVTRAAHDAVDRFAERAAETERKLRETAATSGEKLAAGREEAAEKFDDTLSTAKVYVRENPLAAAGIAFAAGAILSTLFRR